MNGGFIYIRTESIKIRNVSFYYGFALNGGAIFIEPFGKLFLEVIDSSFKDCRTTLASSSSDGGAIYVTTYSVEFLEIHIK